MILHAILGVLAIVLFDGTGDSGDSIYHYLYARYAPQHPELFFNHWAKPLFVLLFSPAAQFGFIGVKILNLVLVNFTLYFTYRVAEQLHFDRPYFSVLLLIFTPLYFVLTFSGLTEPLFAFLLVVALHLALRQRIIPALIIISFLPFVRSEGLFFVGIFGLWAALQGRWKYLPLLLLGTVLYSFAGYAVHHDLFWTITKIPYSKLSSTYGSGTAFHFVEQLLYVVGIPFYLLFWIGFLSMLIQFLRKKIPFQTVYLLIGSIAAFIIAHSIFWYLGIFNSMGLNRVLLCVVPLMALVAHYGFNQVIQQLQTRGRFFSKAALFILVGYIVVFPFTSNPAAINFKEDLGLHISQLQAQNVAQFIQSNYPQQRLLVGNTYFCELLEVDCFDTLQKKFISHDNIQQAMSGDLIVWDSWFAVVEHGVELHRLLEYPKLELVYETEGWSSHGKHSKMVVFEVRREHETQMEQVIH